MHALTQYNAVFTSKMPPLRRKQQQHLNKFNLWNTKQMATKPVLCMIHMPANAPEADVKTYVNILVETF